VQAAAGSATEQKPEIQWVRRARWINCGGGVWTAAGVSAGACVQPTDSPSLGPLSMHDKHRVRVLE